MKIYKLIIVLSLLVAVSSLMAIFDDYTPSARARGMAGTFYTVSNDADANFYNPAGLALVNYDVKLGYTNLYQKDFLELKHATAAIKLPKNYGTLGLAVKMFDTNFEDETLNSEKTYTISHAFTLQKDIHSTILIGYNANLYHLEQYTYGSQSAVGINVGALAIIHQRTRLAFTVENLNNPKMGEDNAFDIPQSMTTGISYMPYDGVTTNFELRKQFGQDTEFHAGVEAALTDMIAIRAGVQNNPSVYAAGATFTIEKFRLDYGFSMNSVLNETHHFSLGYGF